MLASLVPDETGRQRTMMYVGAEGESLYYWEGESMDCHILELLQYI